MSSFRGFEGGSMGSISETFGHQVLPERTPRIYSTVHVPLDFDGTKYPFLQNNSYNSLEVLAYMLNSATDIDINYYTRGFTLSSRINSTQFNA
jgi:hypothetical protein